MYKNSSKKLLVVGLVVVLLLGLVVGASIVSADEPVTVEPAVVVTDASGNDVYAILTDGSGGGTACRRSDCPCGASWGNCQENPWICWCLCDSCDVVLTPSYRKEIGYACEVHSTWGVVNGQSVFGHALVGFWVDGGWATHLYSECKGWVGFRLGGLPEREVEKATVVLDVNTQRLATDENTSLIAELIDLGPPWPRRYYELTWPLPKAELLRLTTGEVSEMVNYYGEPVQFAVPPSLLEERIARGSYLTVRLRFEGAPANNLLDVSSATLYIRWVD